VESASSCKAVVSYVSTAPAERGVRVGLIGLGAIGRQVAEGVGSGAAGPDVELTAVLTRRSANLQSFLASGPDVVVEAASAEAVVAYAEPILASGASLVVASSAALLDPALRARLEEVCCRNRAHVYVPAGALIGLDALSAAAVGGLSAVSLRVAEPRSACDVARAVFEGSAFEAAQKFPGRLNIAASVIMATGADASVTLVECPPDHRREITLSARGAFGEFTASMWPEIRADRLSHIVALSLLATLRRLGGRLLIG
jgi:aspartate dehydrogenase